MCFRKTINVTITVMKKIFASIVLATLALASMNAQDLAQITELYNTGASALSSGDKTIALKAFEEAYAQATELGEEGKEIADNCKGVIPDLYLSIAKDLAKAADYDGAVAGLKTAVEMAQKYGSEDVAEQAKTLIPQIVMQKGGALLNSKKYEEAAAAYKEVVDADPANGTAALRMGMALNAAGKAEEAKAALEQAAANGQEKAAYKQLGNISLKEAVAALKAKKYADAVTAAVKSSEYVPSAQAFQIAGQASQLAGKNNDAIKYFEKYLELAPNAKNATQIAYIVGTLYQGAKNNAKAKEFYAKAVSDPQYGAEAKKMLDALK